MSNLFISHSSRDNEAALALQAELEQQGHRSVFLDLDPETGIQAGVSWERTLYTKLRACRAVVALCSDTYLSSQWCFAEVALARMEGKELFVLQIDPWSEGTQMPSILTEEQFIDLRTNSDDGYRRLWNGFKVKGIVPEEQREWGPEDPPYPGLRAFDESDAPIFFGRDAEVREGVELLNRIQRQGHPRMLMVLGSSGSGKSSLARAGIVPQLRRDSSRWVVAGPFLPGAEPIQSLAGALSQAFDRAGEARPWQSVLRRLKDTSAACATAGPDVPSVRAGGDPARSRLLEALHALEEELGDGDAAVVRSVKRLAEYLAAAPEPSPVAASLPVGASEAPAVDEAIAELAADVAQDEADLEDGAEQGLAEGDDLEGGDREGEDLEGEAQLDEAAALEVLPAEPLPENTGASLIELSRDLLLLQGTSAQHVLLVIDQFEELLAHDADGPDHPANVLLRELRGALDAEGSPVLVLATMRSDYLGSLQRAPALRGLGFQSLSVGPMAPEGMRRVIEEPAKLGQIELEDGLCELLLQDTGTPDALPLLAFTLRAMWDRYREDRLLEIREYQDFGGLQGGIAQVADETLEAAVAGGSERKLRDAFLSLARPAAEGVGWSREPAPWDSFDEEVQPMLQRFIDQRLLVKRADGSVEVAHEALFRSWRKLRRWLAANAEGLQLRTDVHDAAVKWDKATDEEKEPFLWRGTRLAHAVDLRKSGVLPLDELGGQFLDACSAAERRILDERKSKRRLLLGSISGVAVLAVIAAVIGLWLWQDAEDARDAANRATARASVRVAERELERGHTDRALAWLARSLRLDPSNQEARGEILALVLDDPAVVSNRALTHEGDALAAAEVTSAIFDPSGARVVTVLGDTVRIWDAGTGDAVGLPRAVDGDVRALAVTPDGLRAVTRSVEGSVRIGKWAHSSADWQLERELGEGGALAAVTLQAAGERALVLRGDGSAVVWNSTAPAEAADLDLGVDILACSGDGALLLTVPRPKTLGERTAELGASMFGDVFPGDAYDAVRDRVDVATNVRASSKAPRVLQWRVAPGEPESTPLVELGAEFERAAISADGARAVTHSYDRGLQVWNLNTGLRVGGALVGTEGHGSFWFGSENRLITVSGDSNTAVRVWETDRGTQLGATLDHDEAVVKAGFYLDGAGRDAVYDGEHIATITEDGLEHVWDLASGNYVGVWRYGDEGESSRPNASWTRVVTASAGQARVWDAASGDLLGAFDCGEVDDARIDPTGRWLVTVSGPTAQVWDVPAGQRVVELGDEGLVFSTWFSPDGNYVALVQVDSVLVWTAAASEAAGSDGPEGREPIRLEGDFWQVVFSADGERVVTTGTGGTVVWSTGTGEKLLAPSPPEALVAAVALPADGVRLLTVVLPVSELLAGLGDPPAAEGPDDGSGEPVAGGPIEPVQPASVTVCLRSSDSPGRVLDEWEHEGRVSRAVLDVTGDRVALCSKVEDGSPNGGWRIRLLRRSTEAGPLAPREPELSGNGELVGVAFAREGSRLLTESSPSTPVEGAVVAPKGPASKEVPAPAPVDGRVVRVFDSATGAEVMSKRPLPRHRGGFEACISPDGGRCLIAVSDAIAQVFDVRSGAAVGGALENGKAIRLASFSPDGRRVLTVSGNRVLVWNGAPGARGSDAAASVDGDAGVRPRVQSEAAWKSPKKGEVFEVARSPDGAWVVTLERSGAGSGKLRAETSEQASVWKRAVFEAKQKAFRIGQSSFQSIEIETPAPDRSSIDQPPSSLLGHADDIVAVDFSPSGDRIVTASMDQKAIIWSAGESASTGERVWSKEGMPLEHGEHDVRSAFFSPDGLRVVTSTRNHVRVWDAMTHEQIGAPFVHRREIASADFDQSGCRLIVTETAIGVAGSSGNDAVEPSRIAWDAPVGSTEDAEALANLAEALGGWFVDPDGHLRMLESGKRRDRLAAADCSRLGERVLGIVGRVRAELGVGVSSE